MKYVGLSLPVFFTDSQAGQILLAAEKVNVTVRYVTVNALAASAAHGIGVFEHYTDSSYCQAEIERFPRDIVLSLEYCGSGMTGALELENALPMDSRSTVDSYFVDGDLGAQYQSDNGALHWHNVTELISAFARESPRKITRLVLMGESVAEPAFRQAVRNASIDLRTSLSILPLRQRSESQTLPKGAWKALVVSAGRVLSHFGARN